MVRLNSKLCNLTNSFSLLINTRYGILAEIRWSFYMSKSPRIFLLTFSMKDSGLWVYYWLVWPSLNILHKCIIFPKQSCLVFYNFSAILLRLLLHLLTILLQSLLHLLTILLHSLLRLLGNFAALAFTPFRRFCCIRFYIIGAILLHLLLHLWSHFEAFAFTLLGAILLHSPLLFLGDFAAFAFTLFGWFCWHSLLHIWGHFAAFTYPVSNII